MDRIATCTLVLALAAGGASAQQFQRTIGFTSSEVGYSIENTEDRGYITAGRISTSITAPADFYIVRYDVNGVDLWTTIIGSNNQQNDVASSVRELPAPVGTVAGDFIVGGETNSVSNRIGIALTRLDPLGNVVWANVYTGTPFFDSTAGVAVRELRDGTIAAVGRVAINANNLLNGMLIRVAPNGVPIFQRRYQVAGAANSAVSFTDIRQFTDSAGQLRLLISGWFANPASGVTEALFMTTDFAGNPLVARTYALPGVSITADGFEFVRGDLFWDGRVNPAGGGGTTIFNRATFPAGGVVWSQIAQTFTNAFKAVSNDNDAYALFAGSGANVAPLDAVIFKFDLLGGSQARRYGMLQTEDRGEDVVALACACGYALTGFDRIIPNNGQEDEYLVKTDTNLNSGCLENLYAVPITTVTPVVTTRQMVPFNEQAFQTWPIFVQRPDSPNSRYCFTDRCVPDVDDGSGTGTPDGSVDIADLLYYLSIFNIGLLPCADIDDGSGTGTPDGFVDIADLLYFLAQFNAGCP